MIILKASTKKGREIVKKYEALNGTEIYDVYTHISKGFKNAYLKRREEFYKDVQENEGTRWRVSTRNSSYSWSCGWKCMYEGVWATKYVTRDNTYVVLMDR